MLAFLYQNLNFKIPPNSCIMGRIIVRFKIKKDGTIDAVEVIRGLSEALDAEAIRVVKLLQKWIPGQQAGRTVEVQYTLPIKVHWE